MNQWMQEHVGYWRIWCEQHKALTIPAFACFVKGHAWKNLSYGPWCRRCGLYEEPIRFVRRS